MNENKSVASQATYGLIEFKALDEDAGHPKGTFEGHLAVFDNSDAYNDIIKPGAFTKTLTEAKSVRRGRGDRGYLYPLLWQHRVDEPLGGIIDAHEDARGLYIRAFVDTDTDLGKRVYSGLKKGYISGLSIGYVAVKTAWQRDSRLLLEVKLNEGSIVTYPANPAAYVESVKSLSANLDEYLAGIEALAAQVAESEETKGDDSPRQRRIRICLKQLKDAHSELHGMLVGQEPEPPTTTRKSDETLSEPERDEATTPEETKATEQDITEWWLSQLLGEMLKSKKPAKD